MSKQLSTKPRQDQNVPKVVGEDKIAIASLQLKHFVNRGRATPCADFMGLSIAMNDFDDRCVAGSGANLCFDVVPVAAGLLQAGHIFFIAAAEQPCHFRPADVPDIRICQEDF